MILVKKKKHCEKKCPLTEKETKCGVWDLKSACKDYI